MGKLKGGQVICNYKYSRFGKGVDVSCVLMSPCHSEYRTDVILSCPDCGNEINSNEGMIDFDNLVVNCGKCEFEVDLKKIINE
ncbi:hypothetical protein [Orenia metallireducens]|uniref:hypothetical protein n=1 Tax=Orenia metallireducens TaxID=1413210 RepID=UPI001147905E|nr:hypothetical protein [Orenia metallireducens]